MKTFKTSLSLILLSLILGVSPMRAVDNYVRAVGQKLQGRDGRTLVMRGTNCGNWMIREPYMMLTGGNLDRQYKFDQMLREVCGEEKVHEFDRLWMDNNFGEKDMQFLQQQGFNTLRVPMHYKYFTLPIEQEPVAGEQTWLTEGFERIDSMCAWAERHQILLILDMHACPGGQSNGDICDYDPAKPSLWESEANRTKLIALWRQIAERYKGEKCVAAYDLINETSWTLPNSNQMLWDLQRDIIKAIREVDKNHIVILEGNIWCNDYSGLPATKMDSKMMLQFHRYSRHHTIRDEQWMVNMASKYSCPVFIGEFGENSNTYMADAIRLYEEGLKLAAWTCWPMKKCAENTILQVQRVASYDNVVRQWQNGTKPTAEALWNACRAWAVAQNIDNCIVGKDYLDALLRRPHNNDCIPYEEYQVGNYVYAAHYDMGACGQAYWDTDDANYKNAGEENVAWQKGWSLRNDGVDVFSGCNDMKSCGYYVGETKDGEWLQYTIENPNETAKWSLQVRYAMASGTAKVRISVGDRPATATTSFAATGSASTWMTKNLSGIILPKGTVRLRVYIEKGGLNLNWLRFYSMKDATPQEKAAWETDFDPTCNVLRNANCEMQGAWRTAALGNINGTKIEWKATSGAPSHGEGGALRISASGDRKPLCAIYQPIQVEAGHTYQADMAVRGAASNSKCFVQAFVVTNEPKNYADTGLEEPYCIGQLNSTKDASLASYDGMMADRATAGLAHKHGIMTWTASSTGTVYFCLKVGSSATPFSYSLDNITLTDLTLATGIEPTNDTEAEAGAVRKVLQDGRLLIIRQGRKYDALGRIVDTGGL